MRMFRIGLYTVVIAMLPALVSGQELISSQGESYNSSSGTLSWSLGEPVSETATGTNSLWNQGFHQDLDGISGLGSFLELEHLTLYPNPAYTTLTVLATSTSVYDYLIILDSRNRIVKEEVDLYFPLTVDLSPLGQGTYFLVFYSQTISPVTIKVIKY